MTAELEIRALGELEVLRGGRRLDLPASKKTRALLGYLTLCRDAVQRSRLCDLLWDGPADPRAALRWSLTKLRGVLDDAAPRIVADRERVGLDTEGVSVDLFAVRAALTAGIAAVETEELERCAARFRGELLEGLGLTDCFGFDQWLAGERERARNLRVQILAALASRLAGEPARALEHARTWAALEPLDEGAHAALVRLLGSLGRTDEARAAAGTCRALFERELGRGPGAPLDEALRSLGKATAPAPEPPPARAPSTVREPIRDGGLFGRVEECTGMEEALDLALGGERAGVLWFSGEPGIGKTRMLAELLERARERGAATLHGKAYEAETARPYAVWTEMLAGDLLGASEEGPADRATLFDAVRARLEALAAPGGLAIALDDAQWLDDASAALLFAVARGSSGRVLVAVTARAGEVEDNPAARGLLRSLTREGLLRRMDLGPLDERDTAALARTVRAGADTARVFELSGGNPLFAVEVARAADLPPGDATGALAACIAERLDRAGGPGRELLRVGAAIGRGFSLDLVAEVIGLPAGELLRAVEGLELAGILRPKGPDGYDFAHDLLRSAAYAELSDPARRLLHRRIARALAANPEADGDLAPDLARHAALSDEHALAARACVAAGERCLRLFAAAEAGTFARRGRRHVPFLPAEEARARRVELLGLEVHAGLGRKNRAELDAELLELAAKARASGEHATARSAYYLLSVLDEESGDLPGAADHTLRAAEAGRASDPWTEVCALANTGRCLAQIERELETAGDYLREAQERAREVGRMPLDVPWGLGLLAWHRGDFAAARESLQAAFAAAVAEGNHWAAFECLSRRALVDLAVGEPERVPDYADELERIADRLGEGSEPAQARALTALARYATSPCREEAGLTQALTELRARDTKAALATVLNQVAALDLVSERRELALHRAREALAAAEAVGRQRQAALARELIEACEDDPHPPTGEEPCPS